MKISIEEISKEQLEEIIIRCYEVDDDILKLLNKLKTEGVVLIGYNDDNIHRIRMENGRAHV